MNQVRVEIPDLAIDSLYTQQFSQIIDLLLGSERQLWRLAAAREPGDVVRIHAQRSAQLALMVTSSNLDEAAKILDTLRTAIAHAAAEMGVQ